MKKREKHKQRALVLDNERAVQTFISASNNHHRTMNEKSISKARFMCFCFQCDSTPPPRQVLKGESARPHWNSGEIKSQKKKSHTHTQAIFNSVFNTSYRKHQESPLLKKHRDET